MQDTPAPFSVLVADAEPTICRVFEAKLTKEGRFRVACASTGTDAHRLALHHYFDILLWDLRMRESDTLLPRLRALCPDAALLLMSTDDEPVMSVTLARLDCAGVLIKPFGLDTLEARVRAALVQRPRRQPLHLVGFVGQAVTLRTPAGSCRTRVLENDQDTFLVVGAPRVTTPLDFAVGQAVQVQYHGRGAIYSFDSTLLRAVKNPLLCWELAMPEIIHRSQRRRTPRLPLQNPIRLSFDFNATDSAWEGMTIDLSEGGAAVVMPVAIEPGAHVHFLISTDIAGQATVVWIQPQPDPDGALSHRMGLRFDGLSPPAKQSIAGRLEKCNRLW